MWLSSFFNMMRLMFLNKNPITLNIKQKSTTHFTMYSAHKKSHIIDHDNNGYKIRLYKLDSEFY